MWHVALPFRGLPEGKSRLRLEQRTHLALSWLQRVAEVCRSCSRIESLTVVGVIPSAPLAGVDYLQQSRPGLNGGLSDWLERLQPRRWLVILPDVPGFALSDLECLLQGCPQGGMAVACDRHGSGSNALIYDGGPDVTTRFGSHSLQAHRKLAAELKCPFVCLMIPGLAHDVDTLDDWESFQCHPV
jgi:2-phospho-L-lactate guanylyltransferase